MPTAVESSGSGGDMTAERFVSLFRGWMRSIECGLSASSADVYARHVSCFIEALGGRASRLGAYADLAKGGGYIDRLRSTRKATTVRSALFGLRRAFAYVRLAETGLFDVQFCTRAEGRVTNWLRSMRNDARRQRLVHREAEDGVVVEIARLLPFFDGLSTVRRGVQTLERCTSEGGVRASRAEYLAMRDYLAVEVTRGNAHRSGAVLSMTVLELEMAATYESHRIVRVVTQKTSATYGSALVVVSDATYRHMTAFVRDSRGLHVPDAASPSGYVFASAGSGRALTASYLATCMTDAFRRDGFVVLNRRGGPENITSTRLRKAHISCARAARRPPVDMYNLSRHMLHRMSTQQSSYDAADRDEQSVLVHSRIMCDTFCTTPTHEGAGSQPRQEPLESCGATTMMAPAANDTTTGALVVRRNSERQRDDVVVEPVTAMVTPVVSSGVKTRSGRRAGFTDSDVALLTRLYPRHDRVFARAVCADAEFDTQLCSLLARFTVKQVTDRIRTIHRP